MRNRRAWLVGLACLTCLAACAKSDGTSKSDAGTKGGPGKSFTPVPSIDAWTMLGYDLASTYNNTHETALTTDNVKDLKEIWTLEAVGSVTSVSCITDKSAIVVAQARTYKLDLVTEMDDVLALDLVATAARKSDDARTFTPAVMRLVEERNLAQAARDLGRMDAIRMELNLLGFLVEDHAEGTRIRAEQASATNSASRGAG